MTKIRLGMSCKVGDIVLVKFPFTNSTEIIDKKIATVNNDLLQKLKILFCKEIF